MNSFEYDIRNHEELQDMKEELEEINDYNVQDLCDYINDQLHDQESSPHMIRNRILYATELIVLLWKECLK